MKPKEFPIFHASKFSGFVMAFFILLLNAFNENMVVEFQTHFLETLFACSMVFLISWLISFCICYIAFYISNEINTKIK